MPDDVVTPIPPPAAVTPIPGGIRFKEAAPLIAGVVHNGVCADDPRVLERLNEATKIILDYMIPVGGMASANVIADNEFLYLPPQLENCIEAVPVDPSTKVRDDPDIAQGWYEIVNNSTYLDPSQHHDNPIIDKGLWPDAADPSVLRRVYQYPGLEPPNAVVAVTGAKRFIPLQNNEDYLIVQNIEALKLVILSIERNENAAPDEALKYRQQAFEMLQAEVKKHILDPRNYMRRKSAYQDDIVNFAENSLGWIRANIALDIEAALKTGKIDLTWSILQVERRIMHRGIYKDCIVQIQAEVKGGIVYFPVNVQSVLAVSLDGCPIPIRSQFFEHLDNGPGAFSCHKYLKDLGDEFFPDTQTTRRKYKFLGDCNNTQCINAVCKLRWMLKDAEDQMTIKNYEAIRLMMTAKFQEEKEEWQTAAANQQQAYEIMDKELQDYLSGIRFTPHIQTHGFGLGDVGSFWTR